MGYMDKRPSFLGKDNKHEGQTNPERHCTEGQVSGNLAKAAWTVTQKFQRARNVVGPTSDCHAGQSSLGSL